jgi:thiosulfate/3-mercaptopyruvate sulfurtransferase
MMTLVWLLRYFGHDKVALLDGGWPAWQRGGYPVTDLIPSPKLGKFSPQPQPNWILGLEDVKTRQDSPKVILVDSRESDRYAGEREPIDPVAGHIPGAVNSVWKEVTDDQGYLRPLASQQQLWANYQDAEEMILYCGSGVTACVNIFSLELVGFNNVKLYPGGWSDWCSYLT